MELRTEVTEDMLHSYDYIIITISFSLYSYIHTRIPVSAHTAADDMLKSIVNKLVSREGQQLTSGN